MFAPGKLTLGLFFPIAACEGDLPSLQGQTGLASAADEGGFAAPWTRDVPLPDLKQAALPTGSLILPLRHPVHTAKAAASSDLLSGGRLVLGLASGDRPVEFPAFGVDLGTRGERFR